MTFYICAIGSAKDCPTRLYDFYYTESTSIRMPITVDWDDAAQTILVYTFTSPWNWIEYRTAINHAWALVDQVDHPTDTITDMSASGPLPQNLFQNIKNSVTGIPDSTQTVVLIGGGLLIEVSISVLRRLYPASISKFVTAQGMDEARQLIQQRRASSARAVEPLA